MVVLAVVAFILAALTLDAFVWWLGARKPAMHAASASPVLGWLKTPIPAGLALTPTHVWLRREGDKQVRLGGDGFAAALLGRPDEVKVLAGPGRVTRGQALASLTRMGKTLLLRVPANGTLIDANVDLRPEDVEADPFGRGWLATLRLDDREAAKGLREGTGILAWLAAEWDRAGKVAVSGHRASSAVGAAMADGGALQPGFLLHLPHDSWQTVERAFFGAELDEAEPTPPVPTQVP
jgi:glycine cleavage system H protein